MSSSGQSAMAVQGKKRAAGREAFAGAFQELRGNSSNTGKARATMLVGKLWSRRQPLQTGQEN